MNGKIVSVDEAIKLLTEYKKNGGENVLFSSFDLDTRSPDGEATPISITHGIKAISKRFEVEKYYFYNEWYVFDWDEATWEIYTDEEFKEEFELVEDR